jgi:hypothetical protein
MCTGRPPFRATGTMAILKRVIEDTPRPIREINSDIPERLCDIIARLHAKKPEHRFQSAKEVADLLAQYLSQIQQHGTVPASGVASAPRALPGTVPVALSLRERNATPAAPSHRLRRWAIRAAAIAALVALVWWLHPHLLLFVRNSGYLRISGKNSAGVKLELSRDGEIVKEIKGLGFQGFDLAPGDYLLKATNLKPGGERPWSSHPQFYVAIKGFFSARGEWKKADHVAFSVARGEFVTIEVAQAAPAEPLRPAIDLVPLAQPDPKAGTWKREGETLVSIPRPPKDKMKFISVLPIRTELPREFIVEAVIERLAGDDAFAVNIPAFGTDFVVSVDGYPWKGFYSGLSYIDDKPYSENETAVRGRQLTNGQKHTLRVAVRTSGVAVDLEGKSLFEYRGGYEKLTPKRREYAGTTFFVQIVDSPYRIHALRLIPLDGAPPPPVAPENPR